MVARPSPESRQDTTVKTPTEQTPETGNTELETVGTVYHTAQTIRENSSYREEPTTAPELRTETGAKAGATPHSSRHSNGTSKRAIDPADEKVGSTQHSPPKKSNSLSQNVRSRTADHTSRHKKLQSTSTPRSTSAEGRRCDRKKSASKEDEPYSPSDTSVESSSEEEKVASPKHIMKPPKFNGQCSFETFMVQFSNCAEYNKWNEAQQLPHLRNSLEKDAANILWDYGKDTTGSLDGFTKLLESRFGGKAMADKHRIELRNRRRTADETLQSLHSDIRRLAALANTDVSPEMRDQVTCDHFLDALGDLDLALKIRERQPTDLNSALRIVLELEVWTKEKIRHRETTKSEKGDSRRVREIWNKKADSTMDTIQRDMENMKKFVGYGHGAPRNPNAGTYASGYRPPVAARYTAPGAYNGGPVAPPNPRGQYPANYGSAESAQSSNGYGNRSGNFYQAFNPNPGCFKCGDPTHRARECPVWPDQQSAPLTQLQPDVRPMKDRSNKPEKTYIRVRYRQHKLSALIDTGSGVSIAGEDVARNMGWTIYAHRTKEVSVANTKTMPILGATRVILVVAGHCVGSEILIAPDLDGLILGIDWLCSQGRIKWDFDKGRIKFRKRN